MKSHMKTAIKTFRATNHGMRFQAKLVTPQAAPKEKEPSAPCGELYLYDAIGTDMFGGIGAKDVVNAIKELEAAGAKALDIHINSPGGDVFEGTAIYSAIARFKGTKTVYIDSLAASAASYIAMAGDKILMSFNAMMMIHNPWGVVIGNAFEMRKTADDLEKIGSTLVDTYVKRTGATAKDVQAMMDDETWMTADDAKALGFADAVIDPNEDDEEDEEASASVAASLLGKFKNTPERLRPAVSELVKSMENRILNLPKRASPPTRSPGQPGQS